MWIVTGKKWVRSYDEGTCEHYGEPYPIFWIVKIFHDKDYAALFVEKNMKDYDWTAEKSEKTFLCMEEKQMESV
jgi:hypothetical protein